VGFRPASPDRLPMIGAVPTGEKPAGATLLEHLPRHPGLFAVSGFGARGLVWSSLAGELLASLLDGDALPLERDLVDAVDPARYLLKPARQMRSDD
ncbi:MAG: bifunctional tRNA (5-methylaminomethyl-2-thiouridine)(34)-methyltransferase MnmD/FAD-dependent 5-carboxymethylaminomethyl-2-thiouridine(34) oxidoreductase MnmC, partial [Rhodocyclaceae bacterium]|nr:bifunctional tRNA (5-methylaminomethyl-2-thiouridine)(34)-methyltransferase MnmD/FAD-dependent 5-carboxymethylaminomethyl-2-thiouridine(34) oxidoreductase MnmC [Rhodocyclaceae bacterium]